MVLPQHLRHCCQYSAIFSSVPPTLFSHSLSFALFSRSILSCLNSWHRGCSSAINASVWIGSSYTLTQAGLRICMKSKVHMVVQRSCTILLVFNYLWASFFKRKKKDWKKSKTRRLSICSTASCGEVKVENWGRVWTVCCSILGRGDFEKKKGRRK